MLGNTVPRDEALKRGFEAAARAEYRDALKWYERAGKAGSADAAHCAAEMYQTGLGMKPNPRKARSWFTRAGELEKHLTPEEMLRKGFDASAGMEYRRALYWFERAAKAGNADAANCAAEIHDKGMGARPNIDLAIPLYGQAADSGIASAQARFLVTWRAQTQSLYKRLWIFLIIIYIAPLFSSNKYEIVASILFVMAYIICVAGLGYWAFLVVLYRNIAKFSPKEFAIQLSLLLIILVGWYCAPKWVLAPEYKSNIANQTVMPAAEPPKVPDIGK